MPFWKKKKRNGNGDSVYGSASGKFDENYRKEYDERESAVREHPEDRSYSKASGKIPKQKKEHRKWKKFKKFAKKIGTEQKQGRGRSSSYGGGFGGGITPRDSYGVFTKGSPRGPPKPRRMKDVYGVFGSTGRPTQTYSANPKYYCRRYPIRIKDFGGVGERIEFKRKCKRKPGYKQMTERKFGEF